MRNNDVDDLLVEWELARQSGQDLDAVDLCSDAQHLTDQVQKRIEVLRRTAWMMEDPAPPADKPHRSGLASASQSSLDGREEDSTRPNGSLHHGRTAHNSSTATPSLGTPPAPPMPEISGFEFVSVLGRGAFGVVYHARDEKLARDVAIKFPLIDSPQERARYLGEARNASQMDVPGLVPVLHVGETNAGIPYVIQKLIHGKSLREIQKRGGVLSQLQVADLLIPICQAVAKAHAKSIVHRDLKPENILIDHEGAPWVVDFGLAVSEDDPELSRARVAGTPNFMAPEQIIGRVDRLDGRCDIWALGVILYVSLTGRLPFRSQDTIDLHDQILSHNPRPIVQRRPDVSRDWDKVFGKCCAKKIEDRYGSTLELAEDLVRLRSGLNRAQEKPNEVLQALRPSTRNPQTSANPQRSTAWPKIATLLLSCVAATFLIGWIASKLREETPRNVAENSNVGAAQGLVNLDPATDGQPNASNRKTVDLVVAADGSGTHESIAAAFADAEQDTTVWLEPGTYTESLKVTQKLILRGRGPRDAIRIMGKDESAFTVSSGGSLLIQGISILDGKTPAEPNNLIEILGGSVELDDCFLAAEQFTCVRLGPGSELVASGCEMQSKQHPAIFSRRAERFEVRNCQFRIESSNSGVDHFLVGLQVRESGGSVSRSSFTCASTEGQFGCGIEWNDTLELINISDCQFENLDQGVVGGGCQQLHIGGPENSSFRSCRSGIELNGCGGSIMNCIIEATNTPKTQGLLVRGNAASSGTLRVESCTITGAAAPFTLSQAHVVATSVVIDGCEDMGIRLLDNAFLEMDSSQIQHCESVGLLLEGSRAILQRCTIADVSTAGIVVDGLEKAMLVKSCQIDDCGVGMLVLSGSTTLENSTIERADTGILMAQKHHLNFEATCDAQLGLTAEGGRVTAKFNAIHFLSPGIYQLTDCDTSDPDDLPVLDPRLEFVPNNPTQVRLKTP